MPPNSRVRESPIPPPPRHIAQALLFQKESSTDFEMCRGGGAEGNLTGEAVVGRDPNGLGIVLLDLVAHQQVDASVAEGAACHKAHHALLTAERHFDHRNICGPKVPSLTAGSAHCHNIGEGRKGPDTKLAARDQERHAVRAVA